jgi:hypothetical protein
LRSSRGLKRTLSKSHASKGCGETIADQSAKFIENFFLELEIHDIHRCHLACHGFYLRVTELLHELRSQVGADNDEKRSEFLRFGHRFKFSSRHGLGVVFVDEPLAQGGSHILRFLADE